MEIPTIIAAVQRRLKLEDDGVAGPVTWAAIARHFGITSPAPLERGAADPRREKIIAIARGCVGWKEATGKNDGEKIDDILASCGLQGKRLPYCGAFLRFVYDRAGLVAFGPQKDDAAWSPNWAKNPTWTQATGGRIPKPGDTFGIWFKGRGRVAHCGIILEWHADHAITIEGNTSADAAIGSEADRDGQGVFTRRRGLREIYAVRNWLD